MYLNYCKGLRFDEEPDYFYLRRLFIQLFKRKGFKRDYIFDWTPSKYNCEPIKINDKRKNPEKEKPPSCPQLPPRTNTRPDPPNQFRPINPAAPPERWIPIERPQVVRPVPTAPRPAAQRPVGTIQRVIGAFRPGGAFRPVTPPAPPVRPREVRPTEMRPAGGRPAGGAAGGSAQRPPPRALPRAPPPGPPNRPFRRVENQRPKPGSNVKPGPGGRRPGGRRKRHVFFKFNF